jgi:hypothetical protein
LMPRSRSLTDPPPTQPRKEAPSRRAGPICRDLLVALRDCSGRAEPELGSLRWIARPGLQDLGGVAAGELVTASCPVRSGHPGSLFLARRIASWPIRLTYGSGSL